MILIKYSHTHPVQHHDQYQKMVLITPEYDTSQNLLPKVMEYKSINQDEEQNVKSSPHRNITNSRRQSLDWKDVDDVHIRKAHSHSKVCSCRGSVCFFLLNFN